MTQKSTETRGPALWAFLVGIDEYTSVGKLRGCVNDVSAMKDFLTDQLMVPGEQICVLRNEQATRANILRTFQDFLINNAQIEYGSQILFHYSGHGSQMLDQTGVEPDGYNETLVPVDSRTGEGYDIPDKTIAALLDQLAKSKGNQITVILDSCHSGSGTRKIEGRGVARARQVPLDERQPPADLDADLLAGTGTYLSGPSGWAAGEATYVLLAACRDYELSNEYYDKERSIWHGALTYFALKYLKTMRSNVTYRDLHQQVAAQVNSKYSSQMPQCEGQRDRVIFGGAEAKRDPFILVREVDGDIVTLDGGLLHGLQEETELALYPPDTRTLDDLPQEPLAVVKVLELSATTAWAEIIKARGEITARAQGMITKQVYTGVRQTVVLEPTAGASTALEQLRQAILQAMPDKKPSPYLELLSDPLQVADLRVRDEDGVLRIYGANGELLVEPQDIPGGLNAVSVRRALESIVRYRALLNLTNQSPYSRLSDKFQLRLRRCRGGPRCLKVEEEPVKPSSSGGELNLYYEPTHRFRNRYVVEVINESSLPVYVHIFIMGVDYSITRLYPALHQQELLSASRILASGRRGSGGKGLEIYLPAQPRWDSSRDYLKVLLTTQPADLEILQQRALEVRVSRAPSERRSSLDELVDIVLSGGEKRHVRATESVGGEEWTTVKLPFTVMRASHTQKLNAEAGHVRLSNGLTLVKPAGFQGQVTVTTLEGEAREMEGTTKPPSLLHFQLLGRTQTRSISPSGLVLLFEVDEVSCQSITPQNPLRLELGPLADEAVSELVPVIFDGEDYLLAGYAVDEGKAIELVHLPWPVHASDDSDDETPLERSLARALKLFIYKKMGRYSDLGLRSAQLGSDGEVKYSPVQRDEFKAGDQVALFVHGFSSDTAWMIKGPAQFLRKEVLPYDHLLTWDYESFGSSVEENGAKLARCLKQQGGFGPDDEMTLHVYAHSMGGFVSRCMIELSEGHHFVDRLVMAGTPNNGSTLASTARGGAYLLAAMINCWPNKRFSMAVLNWALSELREQGYGLADAAVDSPLAQHLNGLEEPSNVPYLVLAGNHKPDNLRLERLKRLADKILTNSARGLFGEDNDLVIGISSMRNVRHGAYPELTIEEVPSDHFNYFENSQSQEFLKQWVKG